MFDSLWEQATESDWPEEEREPWYRERPNKLTQLPPHQEGQPTLWAIGIEGASPLRLREAEPTALHVSLAFDDELSDQQKRDRFTSLKWDPVANSESVQRARASSSYSHRPLHISF